VRGQRGFAGAKKIDGIKRHIAVDTGGLLLAAHVTQPTGKTARHSRR
jgi:hypothetical protein